MRLEVLLMAFVCFCLAGTAKAGESVEIVTAQITGPPGSPGRPFSWRNVELGATFAIPMPAVDASDTELGLQAGATATLMMDPTVGIGLDVVYHYWPVSDAFKADFNTLLRNETWNTVQLGGTGWRLSALQVTGHVKFVAPSVAGVRPWLKVGAGVYRIDPHTRGYSGDAGFFRVSIPPLSAKQEYGYYGTMGVDFGSGSIVRFGLDASFDHVVTGDDYGSDFVALTIGGHVLFGR